MSRELYQTADIVFLPYNYLLEDTIRASLDIDFNGSIIIFDEGGYHLLLLHLLRFRLLLLLLLPRAQRTEAL